MAKEIWDIDTAHSSINFWVRHMVISKVRGRFAKWSGVIEMEENDLSTAHVEVHVDARSIDTNEPQRDDHLRSADFLEVEVYPELAYVSRRVDVVDSTRFRVIGDLTVHGVTREVTLEAEYAGRGKDPWGNERAGFSARSTLDRKDYGLRWNAALETGGFLVGDKVELTLEVEAVKRTATAKTVV